MNIAIIGAGEVGLYLANLLSKTDYNIILVDQNDDKLQQAAQTLDIAVRQGSASSAELLKEILDAKKTILIAVTGNDELNLFICCVAKSVGYSQAIARVRNADYTHSAPTHYQSLLSVDHLILPEKLVAASLLNSVLNPLALSIAHFAYGNIQMATYQMPSQWQRASVPLHDLALPRGVMVGLIHRKGAGASPPSLLFPHGQDVLLDGDEVTFIGEYRAMRQVPAFLGLHHKPIRSAMIVGGSLIAINTARLLLAEGIAVTLIEKRYDRCLALAQLLPKAMILHHEGTDPAIFDKANSDAIDLFLVCTQKDETNILAAMLAQEVGIKQIMVVLSKDSYHPLLKKLAIRQVPSAARAAANAILSMIQTKTLAAVAALYDHQAEVIETTVSARSTWAHVPLAELAPRLSPRLLVAAIQHRGEITIAEGSSVLHPSDRVIVITDPKYWDEIESQL